MTCFTRSLLGFAAAFWFTLAFAPRVRQALIDYSERPLPKEWVGPKYEIGGRRVTKAEFNTYTKEAA